MTDSGENDGTIIKHSLVLAKVDIELLNSQATQNYSLEVVHHDVSHAIKSMFLF